jgi:hypothetical protein
MTHTPGPWKVYEIAPDDPKWEAFEIWNEKASAKMIANGAGYASMRVFGRANAHLVAAAPDLLKALESFVDMASTDDVNAIIEQATAAIAKARGKLIG